MALCQVAGRQALPHSSSLPSQRPHTHEATRLAGARLAKELSGTPLACQAAATRSAPIDALPQRRGPLRVEAAKKVSGARSLVLNSTLVAEAGKEQAVERLCKGVLALADERRKEKRAGILSFECYTDTYEPNVVHFWERYDTFLSMNDFHASPEYTKFLSEVRPLLTQPVQLAAYEYKDGQIGCMLNPIGPKGEGGLDDATGQGGSGGGASYKQTSQSVGQGIGERDGWGLENALEVSTTRNAAVEAAAALAKSFKSIFGGKTKN